MRTLVVNTEKEYPVYIGENLIEKVGELVKGNITAKKIAIVTDDIVAKLYLEKVVSSLKTQGYDTCRFVLKHGEKSKNLKNYFKLINFLAENELTRTDAVLALGGGVIGDISGFASATYLRGISYIGVPTTLLSATDSSVGGKTAVDIKKGKNLVGAFHQPKLVIIDSAVIKNLDEDVFLCGMGEVAKYALLDKKVYEVISEENYSLTDLIYACVDYKRKVVVNDEFEKGERKLLNLGHTPAHAIEKLSNYKIPHGIAVGYGLKIMAEASLKKGYLKKGEYEKIISLLTVVLGESVSPYKTKDMISIMRSDKKRDGNDISLIFVKGIGDACIEKLPIKELENIF